MNQSFGVSSVKGDLQIIAREGALVLGPGMVLHQSNDVIQQSAWVAAISCMNLAGLGHNVLGRLQKVCHASGCEVLMLLATSNFSA